MQPFSLDGGYPHPVLTGGYPRVPPCTDIGWGTPSARWGTPCPDLGWGTPPPTWTTDEVLQPTWTWDGVTPPHQPDRVPAQLNNHTPPPRRGVDCQTENNTFPHSLNADGKHTPAQNFVLKKQNVIALCLLFAYPGRIEDKIVS